MRSRFSRRTILAFSLVGVLLNNRLALTTDGPIDIVVSAGDTAGSDSQPHDQAPVDLRIGLFVNREVSRTTIDTMQTDAERIWMQYAVQLKWLRTSADVDVIALVGLGSRLCSSSGEQETQALGCFRPARQGASLPVVIILPQRADQAIRGWAARVQMPAPTGWLELRTGTLLGQVLAHEIGHYLLGPTHSATGLMRKQVDGGDFYTVKPDSRLLTDLQIGQLASRKHARAPAPGISSASGR
jgi:hypothetical protein